VPVGGRQHAAVVEVDDDQVAAEVASLDADIVPRTEPLRLQ
jgi:hypothetical protein